VSDSDSKDLEQIPELELQPDAAGAGAADAGAADDGGVDGQWVWQYAAPAPPPSFLAVFFSGTALKELYRFFACALLVIIGCLLPWGPMTDGDGEVIPGMGLGDLPAGYETPAGAISLVLGLWLLFSACYGIYTRRQKILPVFLMIEPAIVTWGRTLKAWKSLESESALDKVVELFEVAGSGVMLTLIGSTFVAVGFLLLLGKVYTKKDDKGAARRATKSDKGDKPAKGKDKAKDKGKADKSKADAGAKKDEPKADEKPADAPAADAGAAPEAADAPAPAADAGGGAAAGDKGASDAPKGGGRGGRSRRGRRR